MLNPRRPSTMSCPIGADTGYWINGASGRGATTFLAPLRPVRGRRVVEQPRTASAALAVVGPQQSRLSAVVLNAAQGLAITSSAIVPSVAQAEVLSDQLEELQQA